MHISSVLPKIYLVRAFPITCLKTEPASVIHKLLLIPPRTSSCSFVNPHCSTKKMMLRPACPPPPRWTLARCAMLQFTPVPLEWQHAGQVRTGLKPLRSTAPSGRHDVETRHFTLTWSLVVLRTLSGIETSSTAVP